MVKCEWHNYPVHGCDRAAKHFCKSLVKESKGIKPAHRIFCDECFDKIYKMQSVGINDIEEISYEDWSLLRAEIK